MALRIHAQAIHPPRVPPSGGIDGMLRRPAA